MNYTSLKSAIADYMHRSDLTTVIPTFITLAEAALFRELHVKELQVSVTGTTTSGYADLPSDFGSVSRVSVTYGNAARTLDYISIADAPLSYTSAPGFFSLENGKLRIWGAADGQAYTLYYIPVITALSDSVATNWLIENAPDLYLYASCLEAAKYIRDDAEKAKLEALTAQGLDAVRRFAERRGQPATSSLQIKRRT